MSKALGNPRYIIYVKEACDNLDEFDGSIQIRVKNEVRQFQDSWNADTFFDKSVTKNVDYIKKKRSDFRGFGSYVEVAGVHILLVLTIFKQKTKDTYWKRKSVYQSRARDYRQELREAATDGDIEMCINNLRENPGYKICGPDD